MTDSQDLTPLIGRFAVLNSGGPAMLIEGVTPEQEFVCAWNNDGGERQSACFPAPCVKIQEAV